MIHSPRSSGRSRRDDNYARDRSSGPSSRQREYDDKRTGGGFNRDDRRRDRDQHSSYRDRRDYDRDRQDGRDRDRDRARDADRDERGGSSRRSASPPRRRRSGSRPKSASPAPEEDKAKPNFKPSGLLAAETKTVKNTDGTKTVLKYHEPPEARKPTTGWRLYVFKGKEQVDLLHIHRQSAYLFGRDRSVVDVTLDHPSCSKQHAVIQFRQVREKNEFGDSKSMIKPFIIDLESTNNTHVNDEAIPASRYYELKLSDVIKFGESAREYVLLSEDAA